MPEVNSNAKILKMLRESSHSYIEMYELIADVWADLKSIQTDWHDHIIKTGDHTSFECYLDLCHALYELNAVRNHLENAYETSLDEYVAVGNE
jgi:hypothetical protein